MATNIHTIPRIRIGEGAEILGVYANRHGLIAGATGTGKTVTLQTLAEGFSRAGVPVFMADVKGDIAGLAIDGPSEACPVRFWDVYGENGAPLKLSLQALGPDLLARMLELTDAQKGIVESAFQNFGPLHTLGDLKKAAQDIAGMNGTNAALQRQIDRFSRTGGDFLIGSPSWDISALFAPPEVAESRACALIHILDAQKLINEPVTYATLMIWLLDELFTRMPEAGDLAAPRLVLFIDEAHLLFADAPPALTQKIERTVRLIRSKGVGVYFVTQCPDDLPATVLGQLGNRIQHALRGATVRDQKAIRAAAETMPTNPAINAAEAIAKLGTGEALVSTIGPNGAPQPVKKVRVNLPASRLGPISSEERAGHKAPGPLDGSPLPAEKSKTHGSVEALGWAVLLFLSAAAFYGIYNLFS